MLGKYIKLNKTGQIVENKGFAPRSQWVDVRLPTGQEFAVCMGEISRVTPNEEVEFLRSQRERNAS